MILLRIDVVLLFYIGAPAVDAAYAANSSRDYQYASTSQWQLFNVGSIF